MKTLIIDTSTNFLYVSFVDNDKEIYLFLEEGKNDHSEKLVKMIEKGLKENNLEVKDFDRIIVGIGPGSYTGLRVGVTVSKVFAWTLNIPLYTVSSLDVIASGYLTKENNYAITMACKKGVIYSKVVSSNGKEFEIIEDEEVISEEDFLKKIANKNYKIVSKEDYSFNGVNISKMKLTKCLDVHALVPNYMR